MRWLFAVAYACLSIWMMGSAVVALLLGRTWPAAVFIVLGALFVQLCARYITHGGVR